MFLFDEPQTIADDTVKPHSPLGRALAGFRGRIDAIEVSDDNCGLPPDELERRLIELGFVEGAVAVEFCTKAPSGAIPSRCASITPPSRCAAAKRWPSSSPDRTSP